MIREATREDVGDIATIAISDIKAKGWPDDSSGPLDSYSIRTLIHFHIREANGCCFVNEDSNGIIIGALAGGLMPWMLDIRYMAAHEKLTMGEGHIPLMERFVAWAKEKGAVTVVRSCYEAFDGLRFRRVI